MKAAMLAWDNKLIFQRPAVELNHTVQFVIADQCADKDLAFLSERCKMPYSIQIMQDLMLGNSKSGLPSSKVVMGSHLFTEKTAYLSSLHRSLHTPFVGYVAGSSELSNKRDYPNFMRVNAPEGTVNKISALIFAEFNFTTLDSWWCNDGSAQAFIASSCVKASASAPTRWISAIIRFLHHIAELRSRF